jgi:biopolymer transport protein ExbB
VLGYVMSAGNVKPAGLRPAGAPATASTKPGVSTTKPVTGSTTAGQTGGVPNKA